MAVRITIADIAPNRGFADRMDIVLAIACVVVIAVGGVLLLG
jgi:hypothetical protein